jgi:hypothetical protein
MPLEKARKTYRIITNVGSDYPANTILEIAPPWRPLLEIISAFTNTASITPTADALMVGRTVNCNSEATCALGAIMANHCFNRTCIG